ncbi:hypothetical protein FRC00_013662 [Tulasnella sp. 408]|nr:hypothetical protein FRC00_013662 [Tulasnella sp. 408]
MPPRAIGLRFKNERYGRTAEVNEVNASIIDDTSEAKPVPRSPESGREQATQSHRQPAAKRLKLDGEHKSEAEGSNEGSTETDGDSASHQLASGSSDDAWYSSSEDDSDYESSPIFIHCGYLQSTTDTSHIIHLKMNLRGGEFQLFAIGKADELVLSVSDDGPVIRQVLLRALETVPEAQTMASV